MMIIVPCEIHLRCVHCMCMSSWLFLILMCRCVFIAIYLFGLFIGLCAWLCTWLARVSISAHGCMYITSLAYACIYKCSRLQVGMGVLGLGLFTCVHDYKSGLALCVCICVSTTVRMYMLGLSMYLHVVTTVGMYALGSRSGTASSVKRTGLWMVPRKSYLPTQLLWRAISVACISLYLGWFGLVANDPGRGRHTDFVSCWKCVCPWYLHYGRGDVL